MKHVIKHYPHTKFQVYILPHKKTARVLRRPKYNSTSQIKECFVPLSCIFPLFQVSIPDSKVHGANMGPTRVLSVPGGSHIGPMNLAIRYVAFVVSLNNNHLNISQCARTDPVLTHYGMFPEVWINSLAPTGSDGNFQNIFFKFVIETIFLGTQFRIVLV